MGSDAVAALTSDQGCVRALRDELEGRCKGMYERLVNMLGRTPTFYFDAITQLEMSTWSRGRVTLVGDAGYNKDPITAQGITDAFHDAVYQLVSSSRSPRPRRPRRCARRWPSSRP